MRSDAMLAPAWEAWRNGDFTQVRPSAEIGLQSGATRDEALHLVVLAAHAQGEYSAALAAYEDIRPQYRRLRELDDAVLCSHVWLSDIAGAQSFAERRGLLRSPATREMLRLAAEKPLFAEMSGVVELVFTDDAFSSLMPGVDARVNERDVVARLDTGGSFIHTTRSRAAELGIAYAGCERQFAALTFASLCHGVADLELGAARLRNVPVAVHPDDALPAALIADAFGGKADIVIGTNVFRQFLTTIDAPGRRLILSKRGDERARSAHLSRLSHSSIETPFAVLSDHLMIANGRVGRDRPVVFFVDSGLAVFREDQGQAAILVAKSVLRTWQAPEPEGERFVAVPPVIALGPVARGGLMAYPVEDRIWGGFGDWSGVRVGALISHGFLKDWAWTIDFEHRVYLFQDQPISERNAG